MKVKEEELLCFLWKKFPNPKCELTFQNNYQLLISVMLSAQCTDKRVNKVTKELFEVYPTISNLAKADQTDVEKIIFPCGLYHSKAKNIISACKSIEKNFGSVVPCTKEELKQLDGVGEKTANVVFSVGFGGDAIAVDTHVFRVSNRLGIANSKTPSKCEEQLREYFKQKNWRDAHHLLVFFGRYICTARNPKCEDCELTHICKKFKEKK